MLDTLLRDIDATDINAFARTMTTRRLRADPHGHDRPPSEILQVQNQEQQAPRERSEVRAYDAQTTIARRQAERMLPPVGQKLIVGELEQILLDTSRGAGMLKFVELLYDDVESIHDRMAQAAGDLLVGDVFTLNGENGLYVEADFGVSAANNPTADRPCSDPTSDPIADELRWIEYLRSISAPLPTRMNTSYKARTVLADDDACRAAYYGSVNGSTTPTVVLAPNEVEVVRARYKLPPITVYSVQISVDDAYQHMIPEDRWTLIPSYPESWAKRSTASWPSSWSYRPTRTRRASARTPRASSLPAAIRTALPKCGRRARLRRCLSCTCLTSTSRRRHCDGRTHPCGNGLRHRPEEQRHAPASRRNGGDGT